MRKRTIRTGLVLSLFWVALFVPIQAGAQVWTPLATPGGRSPSDDYPQVAFDVANNRAIAYGGIPHSNDVWILEHVGAWEASRHGTGCRRLAHRLPRVTLMASRMTGRQIV